MGCPGLKIAFFLNLIAEIKVFATQRFNWTWRQLFVSLSLKNVSSDFSLELQKPCLPSSKSATVRDVEGVAWWCDDGSSIRISFLLVLCPLTSFRFQNSRRSPHRWVWFVGFCSSPFGKQHTLDLILLRRVWVAAVWKELGGWCWFWFGFGNSNLGCFGSDLVFWFHIVARWSESAGLVVQASYVWILFVYARRFHASFVFGVLVSPIFCWLVFVFCFHFIGCWIFSFGDCLFCEISGCVVLWLCFPVQRLGSLDSGVGVVRFN